MLSAMIGEIRFQKLVPRVSEETYQELHFLETADSEAFLAVPWSRKPPHQRIAGIRKSDS